MLFNSLVFIVFFILLMALYYGTDNWKIRKSFLLFGSYLFYAAWNPPFVILLWFSTVVDWFVAKRMATSKTKKEKQAMLAISLLTNLGLLGFFKYGTFLMENYQALMATLGIVVQSPEMDIILPVGISFYTFQTLSYSIDVYRGKTQPEKSFLNFALYVTFFPQLVAGPIVRSTDFLPQCENRRANDQRSIFWGLSLITFGLFQKVVLADTFLSPAADKVFSHTGLLNPLDAWTGVLAFSGQIFCDFSGYSTCAIGAALCFGFHLPDNFRFPYAARGFSDFWRRWHISLSTWLRDYLYISIGGSHNGVVRTIFSLMITMGIGGLWHGASWNFVLWGIIHGLLLIIERIIKMYFPNVFESKTLLSDMLLRLSTFITVSVVWVFFRSTDLSTSLTIIQSLVLLDGSGAMILPSIEILKVFSVMILMVGSHWLLANTSLEEITDNISRKTYSLSMAAMQVSLIITQGGANAFIYFQF